jgi:hypothetical protein
MNHAKTLSPAYHRETSPRFSFRSYFKKIKSKVMDALLFSLVGRIKD